MPKWQRYFIWKDLSVSCSNSLGDWYISRRNKIFWHTARDDTMFIAMRCISKHKKTQVYGVILPRHLTTQAMLESKAYKTYYAYASREKTPKPNINEGAGVRPEVPDVPQYDSKSDKESCTFSQDEEDADEEIDLNDDRRRRKIDDEEMSSNQRVSTPPEYELTKEEEEEENKEERSDAEMTDAQANQDAKDSHETLTLVPLVAQQQSSFISSDLVSKFINPSLDTCIDSILNPNNQSHTFINVPVSIIAETPSSDTTIPQPPIPNILPLRQTPRSITTTILTMTLPKIPNFASLFMFDQQTKEAVDMVVQLQTNKLREEAQAENQEFLNQVDSTMKIIIKEQVQAQVSEIMPKSEKYVTGSLGAKVLVRLTNQPQTSYAVAASLSEFKLKKILFDKMKETKAINRSNIKKNLCNALVESYNSDKDIITSYGDVVTLKRGRDNHDKDEDPSAGLNQGSK
nr:hypothetical protein [Tanacetum cinerariifolium]